MRVFNLILIILIANTVCKSQSDYIPYVKENKFWFYITNDGNDDNPAAIGGYAIYFEGDTIISNEKYLKVIQSRLAGTHPCQFPPCFVPNSPYEFLESELIGYVSEDTMQKKVHYLPQKLSNEICEDSIIEIYDFSLEAGDSIPACNIHHISMFWPNPEGWGIVYSIKTEYAYQKERKVLTFLAPLTFSGMPFLGEVNIFEGVGMNYYNPFLYTENTILHDFCEGSLTDCNILSNIKNEISINVSEINIIPNPATDQLKIELSANLNKVELFEHSRKSVITTNNTEMDISNLQPGLYIIRVSSKENRYYYSKFVKI